MTNATLNPNATLNLDENTISNAGIYYAKITNPAKKYQSDTEFEFVVDVHVDKATAKAFKKAFPKQPPKEMEYEDFVEKFGAENAIGDVGDEQHFIKLKKPAQYKDKKDGVTKPIPDIYRPRIFQEVNGELVDITFDESKKVANGSKGTILMEVSTNSYGTFAKLKAVRVDNLIVYEGSGSGNAFGALGNVANLAEVPKQSVVKTTPTDTTADDDWE